MVLALWSASGGAGVTVTAAVAALAADARGEQVLLVDLAGDLPLTLGLDPDLPQAGVAEWCAAGDTVAPDGLRRLEQRLGSMALVHRGEGPLDPGAAPRLAALLAADHRVVIVDAGRPEPGSLAAEVVNHASRSVLVTRSGVAALHRARAAGLARTEVALVHEPGRALGPSDLRTVLSCAEPLVIPHDLALTRAADAGLLWSRLPRTVVARIGALVR